MRKRVMFVSLFVLAPCTFGCGYDSGFDSDNWDSSFLVDTTTGTVATEAYITAGDWHGHGWTNTGTATAAAGATITSLEKNYDFGVESVCVSGNLLAEYTSVGLFGMNVQQGVGGAITSWQAGGSYTGVFVSLASQSLSTFRIELDTVNGETYCVELTNGDNTLSWADFKTGCGGERGAVFDSAVGIESVQIYVAGDAQRTQQFNYCISNLHPIAGKNIVDTDVDTGTNSAVKKFVGNITTSWENNLDVAGLTFSDYWDQVTPENAGKWGSVEATARGNRSWAALDAIYSYTEEHGIIFKEHAFIWGNQAPENSEIFQESDVISWMTEFCQKFPNTRLIDVVNEPPPHTEPEFAENIGGGTNGNWAWITNSFVWARQACPNAILILNDYNNIEWTGDNQHFVDIVKTIQAAGAPIDAIGAQAHDLDNSSVSTAIMKSLVAKLHEDTGLPIYITEYDISTTSDAIQLDKYKEHFPFFLETEYIHGITIWGWVMGQTWQLAPDSGLIIDGQPRLAMTWLMNALSRPVP